MQMLLRAASLCIGQKAMTMTWSHHCLCMDMCYTFRTPRLEQSGDHGAASVRHAAQASLSVAHQCLANIFIRGNHVCFEGHHWGHPAHRYAQEHVPGQAGRRKWQQQCPPWTWRQQPGQSEAAGTAGSPAPASCPLSGRQCQHWDAAQRLRPGPLLAVSQCIPADRHLPLPQQHKAQQTLASAAAKLVSIHGKEAKQQCLLHSTQQFGRSCTFVFTLGRYQ